MILNVIFEIVNVTNFQIISAHSAVLKVGLNPLKAPWKTFTIILKTTPGKLQGCFKKITYVIIITIGASIIILYHTCDKNR